MTCWNCGDRGGRMVRDSGGEDDFDPCTECDVWNEKITLSKRSQAACAALREAGHKCSMIRETIMVEALNRTDWAMFAAPKADGTWNFSFRPDFSAEIVEARSIINKF